MQTTSFRRFVVLLFVIAASALAQVAPGEEATTPQEDAPLVLSAQDTLRFNTVSGPRISPDDQWVLYTKSRRDMDDEDLKSTTHIWRVAIDGGDRRQLTYGKESATSPAWFPDGKKIAFISSRGSEKGDDRGGDINQVFFIFTDGGEAWQVTEHEGGVSQFSISPDGSKLLFTARDRLSDEAKKKQKRKDDAEVVDEKFRMTHLWLFDIETGEEKRLTEGDFTVADPQWSPDSERIAYVTRRTPKVDDSSSSDIRVVNVADGESRKLYENGGPDTSPRWSPDGGTIAFASKPQIGNTQWYSKLYLISPADDAPKVLLEDFDLDFGTPTWSRDGRSIFWSTGEKTTVNLFSVDIESEEIERRTPRRGRNFQWQLSHHGGRWVWVHSDPTSPSEIFVAGSDLGNPIQLTDANPWLRQESVKLGQVETIRWKNGDGQWIEGVLTKPVGYVVGEKYPFILNPHGGPSGAVTESFNATNHFFAGNGYMILQPNFRGSSNYGQEFLNANRDNWGIRDYDDCMKGVDYCIARGLADADRMIAYGWSYGGYMSYWISTQTDRFKVVSPGAGLSNLYSMYSTTDIPAYMGWFFGTPWDNEDIYRRLSPIRHVKNVTSSILIMHGARDARVPPQQGVEFYKALKDLGKDVTFVRYPRQGHGIREPRLQMDRLRRYLFYFSKHVGVTPISEKLWEAEQAKSKQEKKTKTDGGGIEDVNLPPSSPDTLVGDPGIFKVIEREEQ
ncbi:MAG: S9 family peptidase [Acidobacteriota bacterium]